MVSHPFAPRFSSGMTEHTFDSSFQATGRALRDELRTHTTEWLRNERRAVVREQQRLKARELAIMAVLDERHAAHDADASVSARTARNSLEVARALEALPAIAARADAGDLSWDQLQPLVEVATPETDRAWAAKAHRWAPADLQRLARASRVVTAEDAAARREARELRWWDDHARGGVAWRGFLPDVDGVLVKRVFEDMTSRMRPAKGAPWDTLAHRGADALVELCTKWADATPVRRSRPLVVIHRSADGGADVDGIPIADTTVEAILPCARVVEHRDDTPPLDHGSGRITIPVALAREIDRRDPHCRFPGCERSRGLQYHHLVPVSRGGRTIRTNVVRLCPVHHRLMEPHGTERLVGDPDRPDGLLLEHLVGAGAGNGVRAGPGP